MTTTTQPAEGRDTKGRFAAGNRCSQGNAALRRLGELQRALRDAIGTAGLVEVLRALHTQALDGDAQAASVLLQHAVGRPREAPPAFDGIELPDIAAATDVVEALGHIAQQAAAGMIPIDVAERLAGLVQIVADAKVIAAFDERLRAVEARDAR